MDRLLDHIGSAPKEEVCLKMRRKSTGRRRLVVERRVFVFRSSLLI
jgi:hypothetical protein